MEFRKLGFIARPYSIIHNLCLQPSSIKIHLVKAGPDRLISIDDSSRSESALRVCRGGGAGGGGGSLVRGPDCGMRVSKSLVLIFVRFHDAI